MQRMSWTVCIRTHTHKHVPIRTLRNEKSTFPFPPTDLQVMTWRRNKCKRKTGMMFSVNESSARHVRCEYFIHIYPWVSQRVCVCMCYILILCEWMRIWDDEENENDNKIKYHSFNSSIRKVSYLIIFKTRTIVNHGARIHERTQTKPIVHLLSNLLLVELINSGRIVSVRASSLGAVVSGVSFIAVAAVHLAIKKIK